MPGNSLVVKTVVALVEDPGSIHGIYMVPPNLTPDPGDMMASSGILRVYITIGKHSYTYN